MQVRRCSRRARHRAAHATALAVLIAPVFTAAQSVHTWNGNGAPDANWSNVNNWVGLIHPDGNDIINFAGTNNLSPFNNIIGLAGYRIFFNSGAGAFTLGGNAMGMFDFGGNAPKIENNSSSLQTINMNLTFVPGPPGFAEINPVDGDLHFGGTVALSGIAPQLRIFGDNGNTVTFASTISGSGASVAINQNSNVVYGAANTYSGDTFVNAGELRFAAGGSANSSIIRIGDTSGSANATVSMINASGGQTVASTIVIRSGSSGLKTIRSTNTSGTNTYSGNMFLDADVRVSSDNSGGLLALSGSILDLKNQTMTITGAGNTSISAELQNSTGSGKLIKSGSGVATLSAVNTYTGSTTINGGVLSIAADSGLGTAPGTATAGHLTLNGGTIRSTASGVTMFVSGNRGIAIGAGGGSIDIATSGAILTYTSGQITGTGNTLAKTGPGTLRVITPTSVTFAKLAVSGGLYQAATDASFGAVPGSALADAITLTNGGGISTNGGITLHANRGITLGTGDGRIDTPSSVTIAGIISGAGGLTKTGLNVATLSNNSNSFTGKVTITQGVVSINSDTIATGTNLGAIPASFVADQLTLDGGTIRLTRTGVGGTGLATNRGVQIGAGGGTFDVTSTTAGDSLLYTGTISLAAGVPAGTGTVYKTGANTFRLSTQHTFDKLVVLGGLWQGNMDRAFGSVPASALADAITLNGGGISSNLAFAFDANRGMVIGAAGGTYNATSNGTFTGVISGTAGGALNKTGANTLTVTNANTYDGPTNIFAGRIDVHNNMAFSTGDIIFPAGATGPGTFTNRNTPVNPISLANNFQLLSAQIIDISANSGLTLELNGKISGTSAWRKDNSASTGTLSLTNSTNDFSGGLTVFGGQLVITANNALGSAAGATTINSGASLVMRGGFNYTTAEPLTIGGNGSTAGLGAINNAADTNSFAGPITLSANTRINTAASTQLTLGGVISDGAGTLNLEKTGPGTLVLTNANTYDGMTTLNGGTLRITNTTGSATGTGSVLVSATATLAGDGIISGPVTINGAGTLSPGNSVGELTVGSIDFKPASTYLVDLNFTDSGPSTADKLITTNAAATVQIGDGTSHPNLQFVAVRVGAPASEPYRFVLIDAAGTNQVPAGQQFADKPEGVLLSEGFLQYTIYYRNNPWGVGDANDVVIEVASIPEPGTASVLVLAAGLLRRGRRR